MVRVISWIFRKGFYYPPPNPQFILSCLLLRKWPKKKWFLSWNRHIQEPKWYIKVCGLGGGKGKSQNSFWFNFSEAVPTLTDIRCLWLIGRIKVHQIPWLSALCWVALMIKAIALLDCKGSRMLNTWPRLVLRATEFVAKLADYIGTVAPYPEKCPR